MESIKNKKWLKVLIILAVLFAAAFVPFKFYAHHLAAIEYPQKERVITSSQLNNPRVLVVYQPSGKTTYLEDLSNNIADGAAEAGANVTIMRPNKTTKVNVNDYDIFVFGTPWYLEPSPGLIEFIKNMGSLSGKKVYLFVSQGGNYPAPWRFNPLKKAVTGTEVSGQKQFIHYFYWKSSLPGELKKAKDWGKEIVVK